MSRSAAQRLQQQQLLVQQQQAMADNEAAALAAEMFDLMCGATTMRQVLGLYRNMCDTIGLHPAPLNEFYPKLKTKIRSWKAQALWKKFDARAAHRVYNKGNACTETRVLVIGAGPCGLRTAIEAQLLGAKVVVVEKRDRISRNNVLHLWPFVITDLRNLGAKKFYGKFCAGSIDHISIRQLQCMLLKVALLLGVEVHEGVSFEDIVEPTEGCGWRSKVSPEDHAVSHYEFDVLIGADGKRNTLEGFKRKEFRGKLAIAITANFINKKTEAEAKAEEISGVAFIFNQSFFKELYQTTGIDLENIVYYKDETHYFVMTAKKHSLIDKGVIMQDFADPAELLAPANVNTEKLLDYAREAANFSTKYQMPNLEFAVNHYGKPDVAMFDFTSMFQAEASCRVTVRKNYRLLQCLVGDSLLEPFWPTGSGCARGFLSSMDAAYAIKLWNNSRNSILGVVAQRESIYRLLAQTTPENLQRDTGAYTVDPATRYPNLNRATVNVWQVKHLLDSDDPQILEQTFMDTNAITTVPETPIRRKRRTGDMLPLSAVLLRWIKAQLHSHEFTQKLNEVSDCFTNGKVLCALINRYRPDLVDLTKIKYSSPVEANEIAFNILQKELRIPRVMSAEDSINLEKVDSKIWLNYLEQICDVFRGEIPHVKHPKLDVAEFRQKPDNKAQDFSKLLKLNSKKAKSPMNEIDVTNVISRRSVLDEDKMKRQRIKYAAGSDLGQVDSPRRAKKRRSAEKSSNIDRERGIPSALPREVDEQFSNRIRNMEQRISSRNAGRSDKKPRDLMRAIGKIDSSDWNVREIEKKIEQSKKTEVGNKGKEKVPKWSKEQFLARQHKMAKPERQESVEEKFKEIDLTLKNLDKQLKEGRNLEVGERGKNKVASIADQFVKKDDTSEEKNLPSLTKTSSKVAQAFKKQSASEKCHFCKQTVYLMEKISTEGLVLHRSCLKCHHCHTNLRMGGYAFDRDDPTGKFYCTQHFKLPAKAIRPVVRKSANKKPTAADATNTAGADGFKTPDKPRGRTDNVAQLDLLDRGQTPERIEFENADAMSDGEPSLENIIDENEWTDRNFLSDSEESDSDLSSSDDSDDESESDIFEEANDSPIGVQTLQLANDWIGKQRYSNVNSDDSDGDFYDSSEGFLDGDNDDSQTEGEEFKKAREMRREEVRLLPIPTNLPTDTETEVQSDSDSSSNNDVGHNSATEISTDSEFDLDPIIRESPKIFVDDNHLRKPTKVQIKQSVIGNNSTNNHKRFEVSATINNNNNNNGRVYNNNQNALKQNHQSLKKQELEFKPLVQVDPSVLTANRIPLKNPRPGDYLLNKTASTEGIASKKSLELKKRYLLGGESGNGHKIMKSGSTSILDSKFRNFHSNISECQKLLNPSSEISSSIKTFLDRRNKSSETATEVDKDLQKIQINKHLDEKENVFVNNKNELNKGLELSETVNVALVETFSKTQSSITQTKMLPSPIIEIIDLITPEKNQPSIDLTSLNGDPSKTIVSNKDFIKNLKLESSQNLSVHSPHSDDNEIIDLTFESPVKSDKTVIEDIPVKENKFDVKPDVSKDIIEAIPDIITHAEEVKAEKMSMSTERSEKIDDEPEISDLKEKDSELHETSIQVPNIPWIKKKSDDFDEDDDSDSISSESSSSSVGDIQHYILESTTSPDTQTGQIVPRLEVHDSSGTLMQIDSLMIIDGKYIGDPDDLKNMEIPEGLQIPYVAPTKLPDEEPPAVPKEQLMTSKKPELRFDTKNENKIDSLRNLPMIIDRIERKDKPAPLDLDLELGLNKFDQFDDKDKTPTAEMVSRGSDSETEMTGQVFTETELSDWTADDAISENFVDTEFVLNSNKGTIKRNKKLKKKNNILTNFESNLYKTPTPSKTIQKECGILKNLDIDEIEFMDTGSEGSCAEAYSATNMTMLKNRGYIEFIENTPINTKPQYFRPQQLNTKTPEHFKAPLSPSIREIAGIDYIEQGACILQNDQDAKTPVNEVSPIVQNNTFPQSLLHQSIADNTNDCDDDSLGVVTNNSQAATITNTANTTTEESEALTVVTSPLDSSSPKTQDQFNLTTTTTPSSSDRNDITSSSNIATSSRTPTQKSSMEDLLVSGGSNSSSMKRKESDDMSYEEYVRKLQQKITQISTARDSIDVRKHKRKSSKGEMISGSSCGGLNESTISVIDTNSKVLSVFDESSAITPPASPKVTLDEIKLTAKELNIHKVPEIPTLSSKLEEITKERTKQKDLIHDLVMDKLQSKKQLNAEKRLNRSRNRSLFSPGGCYQTSTKITSNGDCSNSPHYHIASSERSTSLDTSSKENHQTLNKMIATPKDNKDVISQMFERATPARVVPKQRPISEILDPVEVHERMLRLSKTQSFSYQKPTPLKDDNNHRVEQLFNTPNPPPRMSRNIEDAPHSALTDKMRTDARARARLKSNQELGLSPEEKQQLLRKRYHLELQSIVNASMKAATNLDQSDELKARERKMISSKSVNDISAVQLILNSDENLIEKKSRTEESVASDFTSDPNLLQASNKSTKNRRAKDPERRKSLIQAVSNFFSINKKDKDTHSSPKEKSISNLSSIQGGVAGTSSVDGVFNRFKISTKSREKSKDKEELPPPPLSLSLTTAHAHERSTSQDHISNKFKKFAAYSSSPQLFKQNTDEQSPPPIPPLPMNYQRSDDESYATESRDQKKQRAISKATRQAELKRLRIAQEIQREQEEIEVQLKDLEARGVLIEKTIRGEIANDAGNTNLVDPHLACDEKLLHELFEIYGSITQLKKRDEELSIRQQELQLEHRHAQLKEELNTRLSCSKLDKSSSDVAAEGAILNEMLEIVAKRAALRPSLTASNTNVSLSASPNQLNENESEI